MSKSILFSIFVIVFSFSHRSVQAQCSPAAPAQGSCSGGNGSAYDGVNINSGETYWYSASGTFNNGSNINNGGTLRVCGNLTLNQINLNGGTIIIANGGTLTINGGGVLNLNNNVTIANYGTLNINRDVVMQNNGNAIINALPTSLINMGSYKLTISGPNTSSGNILINKGTIFLNSLEITNNSNGVCMGNGAILNAQSYVNSKPNAISVEPGAIAVLQFSSVGQNNAPLSATSNLHICKASSASFVGTGSIGSATLHENCVTAASILPISIASFEAKTLQNTVALNWETREERNNDYFVIEHSTDGIHFEGKSENISGAGSTDHTQRYSWVDYRPAFGLNYYRLKQVDLSGEVNYYGIRSAAVKSGINATTVYPNPVLQALNIRFASETESETTLVLTDMTGRELFRSLLEEGISQTQVDLSGLPVGNYSLSISSAQSLQTVKLVKQ